MTAARFTEWRKLPISPLELSLDTTLRSGQSFRWKKIRGDEWSIALRGRLISLKQDPTHLHYRTATNTSSADSMTAKSLSDDEETESLLRRYLNLTPNLAALYEKWSSVDPNFKLRAPKFAGVRILRQDAWESLVAFISSSNNNIVRISQMVNNLCLHYGPLVGHIDGHAFHDFPDPESLTGPGVEAHLRALGFGYRAGYIAKTALIIAKERPKNWLQGLSNPECFETSTDQTDIPQGGREGYREAHEQLLQLQGVGPKVADCVCLMGLGWGESVPVDTHVWQIAQRDYKFGKGKHKSLTKATYDAVGDHFRNLWGQEAGWAHSVLFSAELKTFAERPTKIEVDVEEIQVKEEDGIILESKVVVKREYAVDEVKTEFEKENVVTETSRSQRVKRRKLKPMKYECLIRLLKWNVAAMKIDVQTQLHFLMVILSCDAFIDARQILGSEYTSKHFPTSFRTLQPTMRWPPWSLNSEKDRYDKKSKPSWTDSLNATDWSHYTDPRTIIPTVLLTTTILVSIRLYRSYLHRIPEANYIRPGSFRKRSLFGRVTSVGDADNFHLFHTPGGRMAGWEWLPGRKIPEKKSDLKGNTIHVRIAGIDAPEGAHFGKPAQPHSAEALAWLKSYILNRRVRAYIYKRDQYERIVATVYVRRFLFRKDVGREMLRAGFATVYEANSGAEFGNFEAMYRQIEAQAKKKKRGMWFGKLKDYESPRDYKLRTAVSNESK